MTLPLPFKFNADLPPDPEAIQADFDQLAKQFPLSRKSMNVESPHVVGAPDEPAFDNGWTNFDTFTFVVARFWKDPMGLVHVEGLVKDGTVGNATPIFTLPDGYLPGSGMLYPTYTASGPGYVSVAPTGEVALSLGGNGWASLSIIQFRQER